MTYYIPAWNKTFEKAQTRKIKSPMPWVAMPTDHQSREYRRILRYQSAPSVLGVWCMVVQLAARMPDRGILADSHGPLDIEDIADEIGFDPAIIEQAFEVLTSPKIKWLQIKGVKDATTTLPPDYQRSGGSLEAQNTTEQNRTGQDRTLSPPCPPDNIRDDDGDVCPSILTSEQWSFLQSMWRTGKVTSKTLPPQSWFELCRRCPEFDSGNNDHTGDLLVSLNAVDGKLGPGLSRWFGTWMPKACEPPKPDPMAPREEFVY